jgi:acetoin utilization deacetylase AcuC-like enzyme
MAGWTEVVEPQVTRFGPTWVLLSAGFDAHRDDPLTQMGLSAGDIAALTSAIIGVVPSGRTVAFLEGGYDLDALAASTAACLAALTGTAFGSEAPTSGGPGAEVIAAARALGKQS